MISTDFLILFAMRNKCHSNGWKPVSKKGDKVAAVDTEGHHCYQHHMNFFPPILPTRLTPYADTVIGDHQ